jgi:hypothetical protein
MTIQYTKALIVVHREESAEDFREIAMRIKKLDPTICGAMAPEYISEEMLPAHFLTLPLLVVYLVNPPASNNDQGVIRNASNLAVESLNKIQEYEHFKKHNIPCLPIENFRWGMELDPAIYGDWVVLKPANIQSTGQDINMVPTSLIPKLTLSDFPDEHLIRKDDYLVQRLVRTGVNPIHYRVSIFLGSVLYSLKCDLNLPYPDINSTLKQLLATTVASNFRAHRTLELHKNDDVNKLALLVADSLSDIPLLGVDIIKDAVTGEYFVIETNSGGNTWHFSSDIGASARAGIGGRDAMVNQYNAWDVAAEALVREMHELAN